MSTGILKDTGYNNFVTFINKLVPLEGIEPSTSSLPITRSDFT